MVIGNIFLRPDGSKKGIIYPLHTQDVKIDSLPFFSNYYVTLLDAYRQNWLPIIFSYTYRSFILRLFFSFLLTFNINKCEGSFSIK